jgi:Na+/citrate or Na+/malate symporter
MKKIFMLVVLVLSMLALVACSPAFAQKVVTLPDPLRVAIESAAVFAVGWLFAQIGMRLPWFVKLFGQYADEIAFALSGAVLATIQNYLDLIPAQWETSANLFLAFVVAVLAALSVFRLLGKAGAKTFRG